MEKKSRSQRSPAVKDLTPRNTTDVKGGTIDMATPALMKLCNTGDHFKEAILHA